ncbi:MAG TPA: FAD-dependent monooxygenase [Candidatus Obscuribacterales bacterium]
MADQSQDMRILVVGAGPTGLMMASELLRHGVKCRIIDKSAQPSDKTKALALHSRTLEIFENTGIVAEILERGAHCHGASLYHKGQRIAHIVVDEVDSPYPMIIMLPQPETEEILHKHLQKLGGQVEREVELVNVKENGEGVTAVLRQKDGKEETCKYDWIVGCDGAHSTVRKALNLAFDGAPYEELFTLADAKVTGGLAQDEVSTHFNEDGVLVFFPYRDGRFRVTADVSPDETSDPTPTEAEFQRLLDKRGPGGLKIEDIRWSGNFRIHRRSVKTYRKGNVFLCGDAAHIHSPVGGQGMNTGLQDAYNLAWKLALVVKGAAGPSLLDSYNEERHPIGQNVLKGTDIATRVATLRHPLAKKIRNHVMAFLSEQEVIQHRLNKVGTMIAVNYRHSPIVGESREFPDMQIKASPDSERPNLPAWMEFGQGPLPGDRAPDTVLTTKEGTSTRLFLALRGTAHNLLLFDGKPTEAGYRNFEEISQSAAKVYGDLIKMHMIVAGDKAPALNNFIGDVWLDEDLSAHRKYAATAESLYLIRPDGYIGFRSQPAKLKYVLDHLNMILAAQLVSI